MTLKAEVKALLALSIQECQFYGGCGLCVHPRSRVL